MAWEKYPAGTLHCEFLEFYILIHLLSTNLEEVKAETTKYMFMSRYQNRGQNYIVNLGTTVTIQNYRVD
jgi:hypothetical protein